MKCIISKEDLTKIVQESYSKADVSKKLGYNYCNGTICRYITKLLIDRGCDYSHFRLGVKNIKHKSVEKKCPVCGKRFKTQEIGGKTTCSYSCANTYFRSGKDNPNWKDSTYRSTCFHYHEKKCIVCGEQNIVEVHHYDHNHDNTDPENLIPLCPTHHQYVHSSFRDEVQPIIDEWRNEYIKTHKPLYDAQTV